MLTFAKFAKFSTFTRSFTSIRRAHPLSMYDVPSENTEVTLGPTPNLTVPLGSFPTTLKDSMSPGFILEPDPAGEPEILVPKPSCFKENPQFWPRASQILKETIHLDPVYCDLVAAETRTQYFHIYDFRLPPLFGRIPEVEDILGTVELEFSPEYTKIVPHSFEANTMYRPVTQYGAMLVSPLTFRALVKGLSSN